MVYQYITPLPQDRSGNTMQDFPSPVRAITSVMMRENAVASSVMVLDPNATSLEVNAVGGPVAIRWIPITETPGSSTAKSSVIASGLGANFDHLIPSGTYRRFAIPRETQGIGTGNMQIGSTYGLYQRLGQINAGAGPASVLIVQY